MNVFLNDRGIIARYREYLPVSDATPVISLNEGGTPLLYSPKLSQRTGFETYLKFEGLNPTASFKDRGMTLAISKAMERGARAVVCASTGNTSAAAAAYAARAGIPCIVLLPAGKIAKGKLMQAFAYGARVVAVRGNFDDALKLVRELGEDPELEIVNSINPFRLEGQKTAAFEVVDELGDAPSVHVLPVGNAGNITAYWKGYREFHDRGRATRLPRMVGFQAEGAAPMVTGRTVAEPDTIATAIRIGNPANWQAANLAIAESCGAVDMVSDAQILDAQRLLAEAEGIFVEPASAASVAGLLQAVSQSMGRTADCFRGLPEGARIVCTLTGHGLKDPDTPMLEGRIAREVDAKIDLVRKLIAE